MSERFATLLENCSHCFAVNKGVLYLRVDNGCIYSTENYFSFDCGEIGHQN